jgi:hypothetical protein
MADKVTYMREYRARRKAEGRPLKGGPSGSKPRATPVPDPMDYGHPESCVRTLAQEVQEGSYDKMDYLF